MIAILSLLTIVIISLLIVRVATVALALTGMSKELARFQARSAFTGSGFTTTESEQVMKHPVRRRIIMLLMLLGNAGIVTVISSLFLSFTNTQGDDGLTGQVWFRVTVLALGLIALAIFANSHWIDRRMTLFIGWALRHWTDIEVRDYAGLLHLTGDYVVAELTVEPEDWLAGRQLLELRLSEEGILVLGIERADGSYVGAPRGLTRVEAEDTILLYGQQEVLENLDERQRGSEGNWDHYKMVDRQKKLESEEQSLENEEPTPAAEAGETAESEEQS